MSDRIKAFLDDPQWPKHITDPKLKQSKRQTSSNINTWIFFLVNHIKIHP